ncbi:UNVERIFIED_CONTAM: hypothetical protein HDU68_007730 [Siphonaria sp. JEL0065]|nr:hypothetical protein HDU68_007730 [Siphonaria sp. JEL0065]
MERVLQLNDIDESVSRLGTPDSFSFSKEATATANANANADAAIGFVVEEPASTLLSSSASSSASSSSSPTVSLHEQQQQQQHHHHQHHHQQIENNDDGYAALWEEVAAVFGDALVGDHTGPVDAFKCVYSKDDGTLFVTPSHLFFVPYEDSVLDLPSASSPRSSVSLARTQSLKQKFVTKKLSLAQSRVQKDSLQHQVPLHHHQQPLADDNESTSSGSLPRNARGSLDYNPSHTLDSRRKSMFKSSAAATPIIPSSNPFHISIASITSVQKSRTMPMLMQPNAIQVECRNTSDNVFSHTSKFTFYGFTGSVKVQAIEKLIVSTVDLYRETHAKSVLKHGSKKKTMSRRPSVGTSNLYTALTGKGADDYIHITSDAIGGVGKDLDLETVIKLAGPQSIKMQISKSVGSSSASSVVGAFNGDDNKNSFPTSSASSSPNGSSLNVSAVKPKSALKSRGDLDGPVSPTGSLTSLPAPIAPSTASVQKKNSVAPLPKSKPSTPTQGGTPEPDESAVPSVQSRSVAPSPLKPQQQQQPQQPQQQFQSAKYTASPQSSTSSVPPPVPPLPANLTNNTSISSSTGSKLKKNNESSSSSATLASISSASSPSPASSSSTASLSSLQLQLPRKEKSMSVLPISSATIAAAASTSYSSALQSRRLSRAQNPHASNTNAGTTTTTTTSRGSTPLLDDLIPPPRTVSRNGFQQQQQSQHQDVTTFSIYGTRFLVNFDRLVDVLLVGFGAVVLVVVALDFWLIVNIVF